MRNCECSEKIGPYHDGELDSTSMREVEEHLRNCPACAAELADLRAMSQWLAAAPIPRLSQMSVHRLHNKTNAAMDEGLLRFARILSGIAACVLVASSAALLHRGTQVTPQPVVTAQASVELPPWVETAVSTDTDSSAMASSSPAAAWYLTDADSGSSYGL
jgi:anti-sigma factor RsiW